MARKAVIKNDAKNVNETIFYLQNQYLPHNEEPGAFIGDIPSQEHKSFEQISDYLKTFSKSIKKKRI